jgi:hypothetical protein
MTPKQWFQSCQLSTFGRVPPPPCRSELVQQMAAHCLLLAIVQHIFAATIFFGT